MGEGPGILQGVLTPYSCEQSRADLPCLSRITKTNLRFDPAFPSDVSKLEVTGVSYLGSKLKFSITKEKMRIAVTKCPLHPPLEAVLEESGQRFPLHEGATSTRAKSALTLRLSSSTSCFAAI